MKVLVFRIGSLGDTLVSLPAIWALRQNWPSARFTLLCDAHVGKSYVLASDLLAGSGLFDRFLKYPVMGDIHRCRRWMLYAKLLWQLRRERFDVLVYLVPSRRLASQVRRDYRFFRLAGIRSFVGFDGPFIADRVQSKPLPPLRSEAGMLMDRLEKSGLSVPPPSRWRADMALNADDARAFEAWLAGFPVAAGKRLVGIGPGSKMPAKVWPRERFLAVLRCLIRDVDIFPIVFGGPEDRDVGLWLINELGRGAVAAGTLGLRSSAAGLKQCLLYVGNDTGTMHMAASVGTPAVAIFSARSFPGQWYPMGEGNIVLRKQVSCEGCELVDCVIEKKRCLLSITEDEVVDACRRVLEIRLAN